MEISVNIPPTANKAQFVRNELIQLRNTLGLSSLQMAFYLKVVKKDRLYLQWGSDTFEEAIADPDIAISRSTAYGLIQVWDTWVEKYGLSPETVASVPYDKLLLVSPAVDGNNYQEMFHNAKTLSRSDLAHIKLERKLNKGLPDFKPMPRMWRCKTCGKWVIEAQPSEICTGHSEITT